ncbi:hypothetical protein GALMADRAFT_222787 [Galerina marginata CBS 339.88]|uniref:Uncharacterized protein n=1 Tax=Galerina marginata (strain CBS 339.88) TaxID=685588 RepID=A0A067T9N7_GALM3|nr:hypothetical protein GALMADRAFT_222787 [Galerina marginata CBS 339.88]
MPFQLNRFIWMVQYHKYDKQIQTFLESQSELTDVRWATSYSVVLQFPEESCPKLNSFVGSTSTIKTLLPSRSITELCWLNEWASDQNVAVGGALESKFRHDPIEVTELKEFAALRGLSLEGPVLDSIAMDPRFKGSSSLEVLEIAAEFNDYQSGYPDGFKWAILRIILPKFSRLKKLVITPRRPFPQTANMPHNPTSEIGQLFAQCLNLRCVDILWDRDGIYRRWVDGGPLPNLLSIKRDRVLKFE